MTAPAVNVLFLCTGNSARSIFCEALLNHLGGDRFRAFSAGSHPTGPVHPMTVETLERAGVPTGGLTSKSWDVFAAPGAPTLDLVITVCDDAAGQVCPVWPGRPARFHWRLPDPAACPGGNAAQRTAFAAVFAAVEARIHGLLDTPFADLGVQCGTPAAATEPETPVDRP